MPRSRWVTFYKTRLPVPWKTWVSPFPASQCRGFVVSSFLHLAAFFTLTLLFVFSSPPLKKKRLPGRQLPLFIKSGFSRWLRARTSDRLREGSESPVSCKGTSVADRRRTNSWSWWQVTGWFRILHFLEVGFPIWRLGFFCSCDHSEQGTHLGRVILFCRGTAFGFRLWCG